MQDNSRDAELSISLLGTFDLTLHGDPVKTFESDRVRALLSYLAVESDRSHRREFLAALLWPDRPQSSARQNLRQSLYNLRQSVETPKTRDTQSAGSPYLLTTTQTAQFNVASNYWMDVQAFATYQEECPAHAARPGHDALRQESHTPYRPGYSMRGADDCPACMARLQQAVDLYRDGFLAGLTLAGSQAFEEWRTLKAQQFHRQMTESLTQLAAYYERHGEYTQCARTLQRLIELEPWREEAHRQRMRVLARGGQRSAALVQYHVCCESLKKSLNAAPSAETTDLYRRIKSGSMAFNWIGGASPYKGLHAFSETDAADFYGRGGYVERLLRAVGQQPVIAVVGPSGSGKSSLIYAGLLPHLRISGSWAVRDMRPGHNPFRRLANALIPLLNRPVFGGRAALADSLERGERSLDELVSHIQALHPERVHPGVTQKRRLLIVIDALEELYTLCTSPARRQAFLDLLLGPSVRRSAQPQPYVVLFTLRADFFGQALAYPGMTDVLTRGCVILGPINREGLQQAIEEPARTRGVVFEPGLVARLLDDVGDEPGNLPLLQFTLTQLWGRQREGRLTHAAYDEIGGVPGALTGYAESVYAHLPEDEQKIAQRALTRMIHAGQSTGDARRPVTRDELGEPEWLLVRKLADARLVVTGRDANGDEIAEVVHEALIHIWERLRGWLKADLAFHFWLQRLRTAMEQWELWNQDKGALLRGALLDEAEKWVVGRAKDLSQGQRAFISASIALRDHERAKAIAQREALERAVRLSQSLRLAANARLALRDLDTDLALALALQANRVADPPPEAQRVLAEAAYAPGTRCLFRGHNSFVRCLAVSSDGQTALSGSADQTLILWDTSAFCADAQSVDELSAVPAVHADRTTGQMIHRLCGHDETVYCVAYSPDGRTALSGSGDRTLIQWDLATGRALQRLRGHDRTVFDVVYHPDGQSALSSSSDRSLILWDLASGQIKCRFTGHHAMVQAVAIGPNGQTALSGAADGSLILWDLSSGDILHHLSGHASVSSHSASSLGHIACVRDVAFGPTKDTALSVSEDRSVILWDLKRGEVQRRFELLGVDRLYSVDMSADKHLALLGTRDRPSILLDLHNSQVSELRFGHRGRIEAVVFVDDLHVLSGASNGDLRLSDLRNGAEIRRLQHDRSKGVATSVDISPDGRWGLSSFEDGSICLWDAKLPDGGTINNSAQAIVRWLLGPTQVRTTRVCFMPDGRTALLSAGGSQHPSKGNSLRLWDIETGIELGCFLGQDRPLSSVVPCPDGRTVLTASYDGTVRKWDIGSAFKAGLSPGSRNSTSKILYDVAPQTVQCMALSPNGRMALIGLGSGRSAAPDYGLHLIDVETGRQVRRLSGHNASVTAIAIGPNGRLALSGAVDGTILFWDVETGDLIRQLEGHTGAVLGIDFGPQGHLAATGSRDESVIVWDLSTGEAVRRYLGHRGEVRDVCITPSGRSVVSAGADLTVREWRIDATEQDLLAWIQANRYVEDLTSEQRAQYQINLFADPAGG